eukprot:CAMPEP_0174964954 /NCGR_PEP_ID=MMETSP0004_2-20121128/6173_1 /TAXON_ID=420556 /ORGANISM="Ochromonas sp., Strain CCMP1393" /LENGTH=147 /DNA_ID=CAMNT_0016213749 /DNA_START=126 /DNA_END=569 /DNA_ORIENTATION=-
MGNKIISLAIGSFLALSPANAEINKTDFLKSAGNGISLERSLIQNEEKERKQEQIDRSSFTSQVSGVRVVDLGGNRGARGLAGDPNQVNGGSLVDQLKAYGGPGSQEEKKVKLVDGTSVRVDNSLKNPFKYNNQLQEQLKLYQNLQQ